VAPYEAATYKLGDRQEQFTRAYPVKDVTVRGREVARLVDDELLRQIGGRWYEGRPDGSDGGPLPADHVGDLVAAVICFDRIDHQEGQWDHTPAPPREVVFVRNGKPYYRKVPLVWPMAMHARNNSQWNWYEGRAITPGFDPARHRPQDEFVAKVTDGFSHVCIDELLSAVDAYLDEGLVHVRCIDCPRMSPDPEQDGWQEVREDRWRCGRCGDERP
jgi:hypothetical protein